MLGILKNLFRKKQPSGTEEIALPNGIKEKIMDDIHLCNTCPMKGRCEVPDGCVSLHNLQAKRKQMIQDLRGVGRVPQKPVDLHYLKGLSWSNEHKQLTYRYKITFVESSTGTVKIRVNKSKHNGFRSHSSQVWQPMGEEIVQVKVPMVTTKDGHRVADLQALKKAAIEELGTWRVPNM